MPAHQLSYYDPPKDPIPVIYEDDDILIIVKPSGLLSVPGKGDAFQECLESRVTQFCPCARIVHRLDMETSGVMVMAKNANAHRILGLQFEKRKVQKTYIALVDGIVTEDSGEIDVPLIVDWPNRPRQKIDLENGKPSLTKWRVLNRDQKNKRTRVELIPYTGRTHQLRIHMKEIEHPILGDTLYAPQNIIDKSERLLLQQTSFRR